MLEQREGVWDKGKNLLKLDDDTFEHDTQAASGSTTGDWFVVFAAPWCERCKELMPTFETLAMELMGETNVAIINAFREQATAARFAIDHYPTLLFFRDGKYCDYKGVRGWSEMAKFCRYQHADECDGKWLPVPPVKRSAAGVSVSEDVAGGFSRLFRAAAESPRLALFAALVGAAVAVIPLLVFYFDSERMQFDPVTGELRQGNKIYLPPRSQRRSVDAVDDDAAAAAAVAERPREDANPIFANASAAAKEPQASAELVVESVAAGQPEAVKQRAALGAKKKKKKKGKE